MANKIKIPWIEKKPSPKPKLSCNFLISVTVINKYRYVCEVLGEESEYEVIIEYHNSNFTLFPYAFAFVCVVRMRI